MLPSDLFGLLLQSRPPAPDPEFLRTLSALFLLAVAARVVFSPLLYFFARKSSASGREVWWGLFAALTPLFAGVAYLILKAPRAPPAAASWNPWVACPYCGMPRGYSAYPCPRCGQPLPFASFTQAPPAAPGAGAAPAAAPALPFAPVPAPAPGGSTAARARLVSGSQILGALFFAFALAAFVGTLAFAPLIFDPTLSQAELDQLLGSPALILVGLVIQDSILVAVALDQGFFRRRLSGPEMGFSLARARLGLAREALAGVGAGGFTFCFSAISVLILTELLTGLGAPPGGAGPVAQPQMSSPSDFAYWLASTVVVAPLAEEVFFRGYALGGLAKRGMANRGLVLTSALFAAAHWDPIAFGALFAAGMVLGMLYLKTGSLFAPILAHATNNFIVMALTYLGY